MANVAIKCRIYPDDKQAELINKTFGCCRKVWNLMLADRQEAYKLNGTTYKPGPAIYKEKYTYLREVDSLALSNAYKNLDRAYDDFFKDLKKKGKNKKHFSKFKSKKRAKKSYTTSLVNGNFIEFSNIFIDDPDINLIFIVKNKSSLVACNVER